MSTLRPAPVSAASVPPDVEYQTFESCQSYSTPSLAISRRPSQTSMDAPASSGRAMTSPAVSWEKAIRPGPLAVSITRGRPARIRFHAPRIDIGASSTDGSCHNRTWCGK